jgi:hypothetical protein
MPTRSTPRHKKSNESTSSASPPSPEKLQAAASPSSPSPMNANEVKNLLASITAVAGPPLALTVKERRRTVRLRKGGEKVIPTITALSEQYGINVPSHPTSDITASLEQAKNLVAIHKQLVTATKHVSDAIFQAESKGWQGATVHYSVLKRLARTDGDIAEALAPVSEFFAKKAPAVVKAEDAKRGHRKGVKEPKGSTATPAATEEPGVAQAPAAPTAPAPAVAMAVPTQPAAPVANGAAHS